MVQMPDLVNLNPEQAASILVVNGLKPRNQTSNNTTNSGLGNKIFEQSVAAGELVDYETEIDFGYYVYAPPAVTITYGSREEYSTPTVETGCNQTPNNQNATNQYFYCTRNTRYYRSKKYENGIWNGEYGQYDTETDANWNCVIQIDQCGNTEVGRETISEGPCQPNNTKTVTKRITYRAGNTQDIQVTEACVYNVGPAPVGNPYRVNVGACGSAGSGGCKCGQRSYSLRQNYSDGSFQDSPRTECCPDSTSSSNSSKVYSACYQNLKTWYYYRTTVDCVGNTISSSKITGSDPCCSIAGTCSAWGAWIKTGTWTRYRTRICYYQNESGGCATNTDYEYGCEPHCDIWRDASGCLGTYKIQRKKCQAADCSYYYQTRQVSCGSTGTGSGGGGGLIAL
jgi:hypothetical protein